MALGLAGSFTSQNRTEEQRDKEQSPHFYLCFCICCTLSLCPICISPSLASSFLLWFCLSLSTSSMTLSEASWDRRKEGERRGATDRQTERGSEEREETGFFPLVLFFLFYE